MVGNPCRRASKRNAERRRALELLAASPDGCTEAFILAHGFTWAGRGAQPTWLREKLKAGAKLEEFAVHKTAAFRKASSKKRRTAKR
jgi:hypothetical protein